MVDVALGVNKPAPTRCFSLPKKDCHAKQAKRNPVRAGIECSDFDQRKRANREPTEVGRTREAEISLFEGDVVDHYGPFLQRAFVTKHAHRDGSQLLEDVPLEV